MVEVVIIVTFLSKNHLKIQTIEWGEKDPTFSDNSLISIQ